MCVCVNRGVFSSLSALETEPKKNHMCRKVMERERGEERYHYASLRFQFRVNQIHIFLVHSTLLFLNAWGKILIYRETPDNPTKT